MARFARATSRRGRLDPFAVERAHIELYARWCESEGKARSTFGRRLSTICGFYRYCSQERLIERDPSAHVRRPKQDYESSTLGLDRNELGEFLVQAGLCGGRDHALARLLALNGLRISEALGADIENLDVNRGHRTLFIHRKGIKTATIPHSPRTARALDLYIGEREAGPIFVNHDGSHRLDRHPSARIVRRLTKAAGIDKRISPHSLRHSFITAAQLAVLHLTHHSTWWSIPLIVSGSKTSTIRWNENLITPGVMRYVSEEPPPQLGRRDGDGIYPYAAERRCQVPGSRERVAYQSLSMIGMGRNIDDLVGCAGSAPPEFTRHS